MFRKTVLIFALLLAIVWLSLSNAFYDWRDERYRALASAGRIALTKIGPIEYVMRGDAGPVILFIHGSPGGYDQAAASEIKRFRILAPSRPGYLSTPLTLGRTPTEQAQAYAALLEALAIERVVVMGVSGGGPSAISFAANYPETTAALITIAAISQTYSNDGKPPLLFRSDFIYWVMLNATLKLGGPQSIVNEQIPDPTNQQRILSDPRKLDQITQLMWSIGPPSLRLNGWRNDMRQFDALVRPAADITVPTLIIHGTADAIVPFSHSERLAEQIPGASFHVIVGGDHLMPITHQDEIDMLIQEFLTKL